MKQEHRVHSFCVQAFAVAHGFERAYGSYEELAADPKVQLHRRWPHTALYARIMGNT